MLNTRRKFYMKSQSPDTILNKDYEFRKLRGAVHRLPPESFVYGQGSTTDKEGVKDLIHNWQVHKPRNLLQTDSAIKNPNSVSAVNGLLKPSQSRFYHKTKTLKQSSTSHSSLHTNRSFGLPLRPSTPIKKVLSHFYSRDSPEKTVEKHERSQSRPYLRYGSTRGFELLKSSKLLINQKKSEFKMKKFHSVQGRIQCWRHK